jgi:hypothetical protein
MLFALTWFFLECCWTVVGVDEDGTHRSFFLFFLISIHDVPYVPTCN